MFEIEVITKSICIHAMVTKNIADHCYIRFGGNEWTLNLCMQLLLIELYYFFSCVTDMFVCITYDILEEV